MKFSEGGEIKTMYPEAASKLKTVQRSLTDRILTLCMSGRFGVREAIAEATKYKREMKGPSAKHHGSQKQR